MPDGVGRVRRAASADPFSVPAISSGSLLFVGQEPEHFPVHIAGRRYRQGYDHEFRGLLVGRGLVTRGDIDATLERQLVAGGRLGENLIALGLLTGISV